MSREVLFRGKRVPDGEWVYGDLLQYENGKAAIFEDRITAFGCECTEMSKRSEVLSDTIGQFTGMIDVNRKEIYEGDIVRISFGYCGNPRYPTYEKTVVVKWDAGGFRNLLCSDIYRMEIVGNIYDNPELIKCKK